MASSPSLASKQAITAPQSDRDFVRVLRNHALFAGTLEPGRVLGLTAPELETRTGLSRPSISALLKRFAPILEAQDARGNLAEEGATARRWAIKPDIGVVVGAAVNSPKHANVAISDLYGRIKAREQLRLHENAEVAIDQIVAHIKRLLNRPAADVVGLGMSFAAPIQLDGGSLAPVSTPGTAWAGWELVRVREHLRAHLPGWDDLPVLLDNDANLSALTEYVWGAARPPTDRPRYKNIVYIEWSRGIGAGLILGGQLYRGEGVAGEIGHTVVNEGQASSRKPSMCPRCGHAGCLQTEVGWEAILRKGCWKAEEPYELENLQMALASAADGPSSAIGVAFRDAARLMGHVLGPIIHFLNPQMVIIGGDIGQLGYNVLRPELSASLQRYTMRPALAHAAVVPAQRKGDLALQGALALVLRHTPEDPESLLPFLRRKADLH